MNFSTVLKTSKLEQLKSSISLDEPSERISKKEAFFITGRRSNSKRKSFLNEKELALTLINRNTYVLEDENEDADEQTYEVRKNCYFFKNANFLRKSTPFGNFQIWNDHLAKR